MEIFVAVKIKKKEFAKTIKAQREANSEIHNDLRYYNWTLEVVSGL